jgi:hypothetical protein
VSDCVVLFYSKWGFFLAISWWEQVSFRSNGEDVHFE